MWRVLLPNLRTALLSATVLIVALVPRRVHHGQPRPGHRRSRSGSSLFDQLNAQISVAASILALVVTWLFLMLITLIGTRQSRRTGGGEVTLFTVTAHAKTIGN